MKFTMTFHVGKMPITIEQELQTPDLNAWFDVVNVFGLLPAACGKCGDTDLRPQVRTPKGYRYNEVVCTGCSAVLLLHERRPESGGGWYVKEWEDAYAGGSSAPPEEPWND